MCASLFWGRAFELNIGCPSERVQRGAFGACLMAEPELVADCVRAMRGAVKIPVTVKHRTGLNAVDDFSFTEKFVKTVSDAGCRTFIVHARNAVLKGLSPKENREIPPLKYEYVYRLKREFPGEPFLLIRYGDHQPAFPTFIMDPTLDLMRCRLRIRAALIADILKSFSSGTPPKTDRN